MQTEGKHVVYGRDSGRPVVSRATVAVRRVYLGLARDARPGAVNAWPACVRQRAFLGDALEYVLDWEGMVLTTRRPRDEVFAEGETVHVHVDPTRCVLLE